MLFSVNFERFLVDQAKLLLRRRDVEGLGKPLGLLSKTDPGKKTKRKKCGTKIRHDGGRKKEVSPRLLSGRVIGAETRSRSAGSRIASLKFLF